MPPAARILRGALVLLSALGATPTLAQGRPARAAQPVQNGCPADAYSVVSAPDGSSVTVLFHDFSAQVQGGEQSARTRCRIEIPLSAAAGRSVGLTSVDYRGFAMLAQRQSAEIDVDYAVGRGNRAPRFHRRIQGAHEGDFAFTDRLPPGQLRRIGCNGTPPVLAIDANLTLSSAGQGGAAMVALDSADQTSGGALRYRFDVRPC